MGFMPGTPAISIKKTTNKQTNIGFTGSLEQPQQAQVKGFGVGLGLVLGIILVFVLIMLFVLWFESLSLSLHHDSR